MRLRRNAAGALVAMLVALALGALLNAPAMRRTALELPFGGERSFRLALVDPLASLSHLLYLDRPAKLTAQALGRPEPGAGAAAVPPPAGGGKRGRDGDGPGTPLQKRPLPKPFKGHPLHLYIVGDSMMGLPGMALTNLSTRTRLVKPLLDYRISSGLSRPDFFDWPARMRRQVEAFDPGAVAVMVGANDNQALLTASGEVHEFGTEGWKDEYRRRVKDVVAVLFQGRVRRVYWIGQPVMPSSSFDAQMKLLNDIYRGVAEDVYGVQYVDAHALLSRDGRHAQYLPGVDGEMVQVREQDGEHLTYAGGLLIARAVLDAIAAEWFPGEGEGRPAPPSSRPSGSAKPAP